MDEYDDFSDGGGDVPFSDDGDEGGFTSNQATQEPEDSGGGFLDFLGGAAKAVAAKVVPAVVKAVVPTIAQKLGLSTLPVRAPAAINGTVALTVVQKLMALGFRTATITAKDGAKYKLLARNGKLLKAVRISAAPAPASSTSAIAPNSATSSIRQSSIAATKMDAPSASSEVVTAAKATIAGVGSALAVTGVAATALGTTTGALLATAAPVAGAALAIAGSVIIPIVSFATQKSEAQLRAMAEAAGQQALNNTPAALLGAIDQALKSKTPVGSGGVQRGVVRER